MPLVDDYRDALDSPVADLANVPHGNRLAGRVHRRRPCSCARIHRRRPWAHLDISRLRPGRRPTRENAKGGTGYGTRLLARLAGQRLSRA